ncbi:MAG: caspase family protein [Alphaproteobacteria bacterium]|nr:caspase family protein [Alphaproteobacteria bacterium]
MTIQPPLNADAAAQPSPTAYALLIGVTDYKTYDPSGSSDLPGARADAAAWWRYLVLELHFPPEQIELLAWPALTPEELAHRPGELERARRTRFGVASRSGIELAYRRLLSAVCAHPDNVGLFTWSGHGSARLIQARDPEPDPIGLYLCPLDYRGGEQGEVHGTLWIEDLFPTDQSDLTQRITYVLDTCYASPQQVRAPQGARGRHGRSRGLPMIGALADLAQHAPYAKGNPDGSCRTAVAGRVLMAARFRDLAYEIRVCGEERGAFTWVLLAMLEQWRTQPIYKGCPTSPRMPLVRHDDVVQITRSALELLNLDQAPTVGGLAHLGDLLVLQSGQSLPRAYTNSRPDAATLHSQLTGDQTGGIVYRLTLTVSGTPGKEFAVVFSGGTQGMSEGVKWGGVTAVSALSEYWFVSPDGVEDVDSATTLTLQSKGGLRWPGFTCYEAQLFRALVSDEVHFNLSGSNPKYRAWPDTSTWSKQTTDIIASDVSWQLTSGVTLPVGMRFFLGSISVSGSSVAVGLGLKVTSGLLTHLAWFSADNALATVYARWTLGAGVKVAAYPGGALVLDHVASPTLPTYVRLTEIGTSTWITNPGGTAECES